MSAIKHILFPFGFSEQTHLAISFVRTMACRSQAKVSVLSVIPPAWRSFPEEFLDLTGLDSPEQELKMRQG